MGVLHVFDMDGTLLAGTSASLQIARSLGGDEALMALEARLAAGELDSRGFAQALHELWRELTPATVEAAFADSPWLSGIDEVCADIRARGERSLVITMSPDFFAHHLLSRGFDDVRASRFPPPPFTSAVDPALILTPQDKVRIVDELREQDLCVAYGDSMSDAPLFRHLTATVAVNADRHLDGIAAARYHGDDLFQAYQLGRQLIS
jgi:phosphoserine phosphatase